MVSIAAQMLKSLLCLGKFIIQNDEAFLYSLFEDLVRGLSPVSSDTLIAHCPKRCKHIQYFIHLYK